MTLFIAHCSCGEGVSRMNSSRAEDWGKSHALRWTVVNRPRVPHRVSLYAVDVPGDEDLAAVRGGVFSDSGGSIDLHR